MSSDTLDHRHLANANTLSVNLVGNGGVSGGAGAINCGLGANICPRTSPRTPR
jgi:hypothetical protein